MKAIRNSILLVAALLVSAPVFSQGDDQADVWATVEAQWAAVQKKDKKWVERMLASEFVGWGKTSPAPRNKASVQMWDRYTSTLGSLQTYELYPLSIVVRGDMAVAHYTYSNAYEDKNGDVEMNNGRFTDVLVRTADGWKFIAWHGGDDKK